MYEAPEFSIKTASLNGSIVISVSGELDLMTTPEVEKALDACNGGEPVVADLTELTFIDSTGLHLLLKDRSNGKPAALVVAPESHVARVLDIIQATDQILLCSDLDAAIQGAVHPDSGGRPPRGVALRESAAE